MIIGIFVFVTCLVKQSFERPVDDCDGKIKLHHKKKFLAKIKSSYVLVQKSSIQNNYEGTAASTPIIPTKNCPFRESSFEDRDSQRIPRVITHYECPALICSSSCKKVTVRRRVLQEKCNPKLGKVYTLSYVDVIIGFIELI